MHFPHFSDLIHEVMRPDMEIVFVFNMSFFPTLFWLHEFLTTTKKQANLKVDQKNVVCLKLRRNRK